MEIENNTWNIETTTIMNPEELLVYYLYKYDLDVMAKKERLAKEDAYFIKKYAQMLGLIKKEEASNNVYKGNI